MISKEQMSQVFDQFYRSDDPILLARDDVGPGISICPVFIKILIEEIRLDSASGKGTNFFFSLPRS